MSCERAIPCFLSRYYERPLRCLRSVKLIQKLVVPLVSHQTGSPGNNRLLLLPAWLGRSLVVPVACLSFLVCLFEPWLDFYRKSTKTVILVHSDCCNRIPQTGWVRNNRNLSELQRLGSPRSSSQQIWWEPSYHSLTWQKGWEISLGFL